MTALPLNTKEIALLIEALAMSAARHESLAAFRPRGRNRFDHDEKAKQMRALRTFLLIGKRGIK